METGYGIKQPKDASHALQEPTFGRICSNVGSASWTVPNVRIIIYVLSVKEGLRGTQTVIVWRSVVMGSESMMSVMMETSTQGMGAHLGVG